MVCELAAAAVALSSVAVVLSSVSVRAEVLAAAGVFAAPASFRSGTHLCRRDCKHSTCASHSSDDRSASVASEGQLGVRETGPRTLAVRLSYKRASTFL
jgi:hypothetical protein